MGGDVSAVPPTTVARCWIGDAPNVGRPTARNRRGVVADPKNDRRVPVRPRFSTPETDAASSAWWRKGAERRSVSGLEGMGTRTDLRLTDMARGGLKLP